MEDHLCDELIGEIFSRLPTKSLLRFRSVSRSLCGLICSPDFIRLHSVRSSKKFTVVHRVNCKEEGATKSVYTINPVAGEGRLSYSGATTPVKYPFEHMNIVGSCNGILCVYEHDRNIIHLWNPSIRRKVTLRAPPPWVPGLALGFGFDPIINDYKILWTARGAGSFVYTMKTHEWHGIDSPAAMDCFSVVNSPLCLFNGALHWAVKRHFRRRGCYLMAFDLSSEVFSTIELPKPNWETNAVTLIKGCLAVLSSSSSKDDGDSRIWVRTAAGSWSLAFKWNTRRQPVQSINGDLLFSRHSKGGILDYHDPETGVPSTLVNLTDSSYVAGMVTCIESLELLDMGASCDQGMLPFKRCLELLSAMGTPCDQWMLCLKRCLELSSDMGTTCDQGRQNKKWLESLLDMETTGKQNKRFLELLLHMGTSCDQGMLQNKRCLDMLGRGTTGKQIENVFELSERGTSCDQGKHIKNWLELWLDMRTTGKQIKRGFEWSDTGTTCEQGKQNKRCLELSDAVTTGKRIERGFELLDTGNSCDHIIHINGGLRLTDIVKHIKRGLMVIKGSKSKEPLDF